jgi:hypothetical protein
MMSFLFGKKPQPSPTVRMPVQGDAASRGAAQRQRSSISERTGRTSTFLGQRQTGEAGTESYKNSLLGQAG